MPNILRWNHINLPELNCQSMCLVKLSMHNGTGIGYYSPSTCTQFASQVGRGADGGLRISVEVTKHASCVSLKTRNAAR